ncbi:multiple sugar transport system permease protein [Kineococcus radiotolerans]|uniref:Multiple sugar transport system permease protein n=1 Tax=Kineococcus radiotolerans TaxID=131568 RepID=A0A7W4XZD3_KINRA|nr:multiple sugar transport system permease protein [Kineococcus radiotolerans]
MTRAQRRTAAALCFMAPALIILTAFVGWPMLSALRTSLFDSSGFGRERFVGVENYVIVFTDATFLRALANTTLYALLFTPLALITALGLALLFNDPRLPLRGLFRTAMFLPFIVSLAVAALAWQYLIDPQVGLVNYWLRGAGIQLGDVLQDPTLAMPAVVLVAVWKSFGFYMVIFLAGLQDVPDSLYEAARMDGAGALGRFRHVTLPMLTNTTTFVVIFALIAALQAFDQIYVMTQGGPYHATDTVVTQIYETGFQDLDLGLASALSYVLLLATLVLSLGQFLLASHKEKDVSA